MKKRLDYILIVVLSLLFLIFIPYLSSSINDAGNTIGLDNTYKLNFSDNPSFKEKEFDDSTWHEASFMNTRVSVDSNLVNKPLWARKHFTIPSDLSSKDLAIFVNGLTNGHELYFNGTLIGKTPIYPNNYFNDWNYNYYYFIPHSIIEYDKDNVIAIKSYSTYEYGYSTPLLIGESSVIISKSKYLKSFKVDLFWGLSILMLSIGIYFGMVYFSNKCKTKLLYFSIINIIAAIYYSNFTVYHLDISYLMFQRIIFISMHMFFLLILPFLKEFLNMKVKAYDKWICIILGLISIIGCFSSKNLIELNNFRSFYLNFFLLLFLYYIKITAKGIICKNKAILKLTLSVPLTIILGLHDTLYRYFGRQPDIGFELNGFALIVFLIPISIELIKEYTSLYMQASTDGLTGLYNHIYFHNTVDNLLKEDETTLCSIIMLDIDNFKAFNDTYGHTIGDHVLKITARALKDYSFKDSYAARYGGEEFIILVKGYDETASFNLAEKLRNKIEQLDFSLPDNTNLNITVSIGVSTSSPLSPESSAEGLIDKADKALYESKRRGKNRTTHYNELHLPFVNNG